jgi:lipopolysaccharide assembly outer membrane protein LptD (OstA)
MNADRVVYDEKKSMMKLIGNVVFTGQETVVKAPFAEYDMKTRLATLRGGVTFIRSDTVLSSRQVRIYYSEHRAILLGEIRAVTTRPLATVKDRKLNEEITDSKSVISCDRLELDWMKKTGKAEGNIVLEQKKVRIFADRARYSESDGTAVLTGHVRIERKPNDWLVCQEALVDLHRETYEARGAVHGKYVFQEKSASSPTPGPSPSPGEAAGMPGTDFGEKVDSPVQEMIIREEMRTATPAPLEKDEGRAPEENAK